MHASSRVGKILFHLLGGSSCVHEIFSSNNRLTGVQISSAMDFYRGGRSNRCNLCTTFFDRIGDRLNFRLLLSVAPLVHSLLNFGSVLGEKGAVKSDIFMDRLCSG